MESNAASAELAAPRAVESGHVPAINNRPSASIERFMMRRPENYLPPSKESESMREELGELINRFAHDLVEPIDETRNHGPNLKSDISFLSRDKSFHNLCRHIF